MILRSLELKQFGRFSERSFEFRRGLNLVVGPNETGKSTLVEAIPAILFGSPDAERFRPWGRPGECRAALVLESGSSTVRIERDLLSDLTELEERDDLYQVRDSFSGKIPWRGRSAGRADYLERLSRLFGVADEELFRASLFFGQGALGLGGSESFAARVRSLVTGAVDTDYEAVLAALEADYFSVTKENPWGRDRSRDRELEQLRSRLAELERRQADAAVQRAAAAKLQVSCDRLRERLAGQRRDFEQGRRYLDWARQQWQRLQGHDAAAAHPAVPSAEVAALLKEREELKRDYRQTGLPEPIPEELPVLLAEAAEIRQELVAVGGETARLRQALLKLPRPPWPMALALTLVLALAVATTVWLAPGWLWPALGGGLAVSCGGWGLVSWKFMQLRARRGHLQGQGTILEQQRETAQGRLADLDDRFETLGLSPSAVEVARMQKNLERARRISGRLQAIEGALQALAAKAPKVSEGDSASAPANLLPFEELPEAEIRLQELGAAIATDEGELLQLVEQEAALQGQLLAAESLEQDLDGLRRQEAALTRRRNVLSLSVDLLGAAVEEYHQAHFASFAEELGYTMRLLSGGRYGEVRCDEHFRFALRGKGNSWQPLEHFSSGTVDACRLAVRLALTRRLARNRHLPLILDDPLVNLDRGRVAEALKVLERLSSEHQVILFSHDEQLLKRAARDRWHVIPLEETRGAPPQSPQERNDDGGQLHLL